MKDKVQVFILRHDAPHKSRISHLNTVFNNRMFDVELKVDSGIALDDRIINCLKESWRINPQAYCLILTDRVISSHSSRSVMDIIKKCIAVKNFDLAYLFKYNDKCQMHNEIESYGSTAIVECHAPRGLEAILYSPSGRDIILGKRPMKNKSKFHYKKSLENMLNKSIYNGDLKCISVSPNLFEYDITNNLLNNSHYEYRNECAPLQLQPPPAVITSSRMVVILAFILILIIVTSWALLQLGICPTVRKNC